MLQWFRQAFKAMIDSILGLAQQIRFLFTHLTISNLLDMTLVAAIFFVAFQALYQTRALQLLRGVIFAAILGGGLLVALPLITLNWLVRFALIAGAIALPILFQDELRRILVGLGQFGRQRGTINNFDRFKKSLISAAEQLSASRTGALIILEGQTLLEDVIQTGVRLGAETLSPELLLTIFSPKTPLHDGAVVLRGDRLVAASCILPVETDNIGDSQLGTRHRAGLGLSIKVPDALVLIFSEEKGWISVAFGGRLYLHLSIPEVEDWINRFGAQLDHGAPSGWGWLVGGGLRQILINLITSIALAVIAWVIVMYQTNPPGQALLQGVPLEIEGLATDLLVMSDLPDSVNVQVQTTTDRMEALSVSSVQASLDLTDVSAGFHSVPINVSAEDAFVQIFSVSPQSLDVTLEQEISETITSTANLVDLANLPPGYVVDEIDLAPALITLTGPKSLVEAVAAAQIDILIGNRRTNFQETITPSLVNQTGQSISGVSMQPAQVVATVTIRQTFSSREIGVQVQVDQSGLNPDFQVSGVKVTPPMITLIGSQGDLDNIGAFLSTAPISLTNQTGNFNADIPLIVPEGVAALGEDGQSIRSVRAAISITPVTGYLVLESVARASNLPEGLQVEFFPRLVSVLLTGPQYLLSEVKLDPRLVDLRVNLAGLSAGVYSLPLEIVVPAGLQAQVFPQEIQVTIQ